MRFVLSIVFFLLFSFLFFAQTDSVQHKYFSENYTKSEITIKMRDGVRLFTAIYQPNNNIEKQPIIIWRTPYSCSPYGENIFFKRRINTFFHFMKENYIIVIQDVRGRFMSEGEFINMCPYISNKTSNNQIDETTDTYDSVEWLVNNVQNNNGNVGIWGISYPGFYAAMATIDAHPAVKAVSPQAPIADWYIGDDMHHNGAFSLLISFNFFDVFGVKREGLTKTWPKGIKYPSPDAYNFFLELGSLKNININFFKNKIAFYDSTVAHPHYDYFWQARNTRNHFNNIKPAVMTVGGWYDGEDLFGALQTYNSIEIKNEKNKNTLVMGPWTHGGWTRTKGEELAEMNFGVNTSAYYINNIELPFFNYYLKNEKTENFHEAQIFNTGSNKWYKFEKYPPENLEKQIIYLSDNNKLDFNISSINNADCDTFISDPHKPVPYTAKVLDSQKFYNKEYMVEDQRFASSRPDVLVYESESLEKDLTIIGAIDANLFVSTSGTDSDWIVKVIDVFPDDELDPEPNPNNVEMGGYEMLVRGEIMRGKYRNSFEFPKPFVPNEITEVNFTLNDVCHTFKKSHQIMVQIQSSWFPLYDRNPQTFVNIYNAEEIDFIKATQRIFHSEEFPSNISFRILK